MSNDVCVSDVLGGDEVTLSLVVSAAEFMVSSDADGSWRSSAGWDEGDGDDDKAGRGGEEVDIAVSVFGGASSLVVM